MHLGCCIPVNESKKSLFLMGFSGEKSLKADKKLEKLNNCCNSYKTCHCKDENLPSPLKSKMKVLKKIKRRMGLASSNTVTCPRPNNLPPLRFHYVHGDNIRISRDGSLAKRYESFNKGVTFSDRPVKTNERVFIKFSEISSNWSGVIRFGFTCNDPTTLRNNLPKYACPDLTNKPGFWAKALNERYCERDNILFYYVTSAGDVYFGINGEEKGVFFTIPPPLPRGPLWALIDVYGNCSAIEFLDSRVCLYQHHSSSRQSMPSVNSYVEIERIIPNMQSLSVNNDRPALSRSRSSTSLRSPLTPVPFHRTRGRNIGLSPDKMVATHVDTEFCQGYVFTARPIRIGEKLIVQILRTEPMYVGALALGLTSCDPASLQPSDLPDDSDLLLDRPEHWVVSKDIASNPVRGDEIIFSITPNGEVQISKNDGPPSVVMHVDQSLTLWAFLDVYGSTQSVRVLSQMAASPQYQTPSNSTSMLSIQQRPISQRYASQNIASAESISSIELLPPAQLAQSRRSINTVTSTPTQTNRVMPSSDMIQLQSGGTVLVVNLPPATSNNDISGNSQSHQPQITQMPIASTTVNAAPILPAYASNYVEAKLIKSGVPPPAQYSSVAQWQDMNAANLGTGNECTICYEHSIDSVLYTCGHMCMCYECAVKQWHGIGGGHCPLCRAIIRDVIRIYKS